MTSRRVVGSGVCLRGRLNPFSLGSCVMTRLHAQQQVLHQEWRSLLTGNAWSLAVLLCTARPLFLVVEASGESFSAQGCYQSRSTPASALHSNEQHHERTKPSGTAVGAVHGASACDVLGIQCLLRRCRCRQYACQKLQSRHQGDGDGTEASACVLLTLAAPA